MRIVRSSPEERALLLDAIRDSANEDGTVRVLEAGCGNRWGLKPDGLDIRITGIDTDADALRIRREQHGDLETAIVGDLRDVEIPAGQFDVAYCSYVLEHVENAERALDRMAAGVRPGGRMIIRVPDRDSVFGWAARHTPHRTHVWFKKYIERQQDAGKPGHAPYPVVYDKVVSVRGMREWVSRKGFTIETEYATHHFVGVFGPFAPLVKWGLRLVSKLSRGRLSGEWNNICYIVVV